MMIYVRRENGSFTWTDGSETIQDLRASGCDLETSKRKGLLTSMLNGFGVRRDGLDARLTKTVRIGANRRIDLLVEAFNLTNHANFRPPLGSQPQEGVSLNTASALVRTAARDARHIQWGLRYAF